MSKRQKRKQNKVNRQKAETASRRPTRKWREMRRFALVFGLLATAVGTGLAAFKQAMPIAPCSNGSIALMTALARFGGLPWDCILGAEIARDYKPKPAVYLGSCAALRLPPEEVVMVACHNDDLAAARAVGLKTGFIPRPDEKGPGLGEAAPSADWDFLGDDLIDLAAAVAGG